MAEPNATTTRIPAVEAAVAAYGFPPPPDWSTYSGRSEVTICDMNSAIAGFNINGSVEPPVMVALDATRVLIYYRNVTTSLGYLVVGTVSDTGITFGTPIDGGFTNGGATVQMALIGTDKVLMTYYDAANNTKAVVSTIAGTVPSVGAHVAVVTGSAAETVVCALNTDVAAVVAFTTNTNQGNSYILTVAGTVITVNANTTFEAAASGWNGVRIAKLTTTSFAVLVGIAGGATRLIIASVAGTTITFGADSVVCGGILAHYNGDQMFLVALSATKVIFGIGSNTDFTNSFGQATIAGTTISGVGNYNPLIQLKGMHAVGLSATTAMLIATAQLDYSASYAVYPMVVAMLTADTTAQPLTPALTHMHFGPENFLYAGGLVNNGTVMTIVALSATRLLSLVGVKMGTGMFPKIILHKL